jgi:RNA polymerase sigma factor (sigma-70 family)
MAARKYLSEDEIQQCVDDIRRGLAAQNLGQRRGTGIAASLSAKMNAAVKRLVETHQHAVMKYVRTASAQRGGDVEDVRQHIAIAVVEAAKRYDPARGSFICVLIPLVQTEMQIYAKMTEIVRRPRQVSRAHRRVRELSEMPTTVEEIQRALPGITAGMARRVLSCPQQISSVDELVEAGREDEVGIERTTPEDTLSQAQILDAVRTAVVDYRAHIQSLSGPSSLGVRRMVTLDYLADSLEEHGPRKLHEYAEKHGVSKERVRQILTDIKSDLRERLSFAG